MIGSFKVQTNLEILTFHLMHWRLGTSIQLYLCPSKTWKVCLQSLQSISYMIFCERNKHELYCYPYKTWKACFAPEPSSTSNALVIKTWIRLLSQNLWPTLVHSTQQCWWQWIGYWLSFSGHSSRERMIVSVSPFRISLIILTFNIA